MSTKRFHEMFVDYAFRVAGDYEDRISALEWEIKKLKSVIEHIRVESEPDIELDGSFHSGFDVRGQVDSTVYLNVGQGIHQDDIDINALDYCEKCDELKLLTQKCKCLKGEKK